jgi:hypothetical protein
MGRAAHDLGVSEAQPDDRCLPRPGSPVPRYQRPRGAARRYGSATPCCMVTEGEWETRCCQGSADQSGPSQRPILTQSRRAPDAAAPVWADAWA